MGHSMGGAGTWHLGTKYPNLWAGLVILAGGAVFLAWARLRPLRAEDLKDTDTDRTNID